MLAIQKMSFFAKFLESNGSMFRVDTRVYLQDGVSPKDDDKCVAAVIGKNPGSAAPICFDELAPLSLERDNMLPTVRNWFVSAYRRALKKIPDGAFVRVWNLFYLCDPDLRSAIRRHKEIHFLKTCSTEQDLPPLVWFAWGGCHPVLDSM